MIINFDWNDLRYFLAVARTGRLTTAAQLLRQTHMTVSRRVAALEKAMATKLFQKQTDGYKLTLAGQRLLPKVQHLEGVMLGVSDDIGGCDARAEGTVRIGAPAGFGCYFLASRLAALLRANPLLRLELIASDRHYSLTKRDADISISFVQPARGPLVSQKLTDYQLGLYASTDYIKRAPSIETPLDLSKHLLIDYIEDLQDVAELNWLVYSSYGASAHFFSTNITAQLQATLAGEGICILPHFIAKHEPSLQSVLPSILITRSYWLVTHADTRALARIRVARDFIVREVKAMRDYFSPYPTARQLTLAQSADLLLTKNTNEIASVC
jgi:DNA-binding transcriptional LysR family regulator